MGYNCFMGRGPRPDKANVVSNLRSRVSKLIRGYQMSEPAPRMPFLVGQQHIKLKKIDKVILGRNDNGSRKTYFEDMTNAYHVLNDALCAYELMNQCDPDDLQSIEAYGKEIDSLIDEATKWYNGDYPADYSESHKPYFMKYGIPECYMPENYSRPNGPEKAQSMVKRINEDNEDVWRRIVKINKKYDAWQARKALR